MYTASHARLVYVVFMCALVGSTFARQLFPSPTPPLVAPTLAAAVCFIGYCSENTVGGDYPAASFVRWLRSLWSRP